MTILFIPNFFKNKTPSTISFSSSAYKYTVDSPSKIAFIDLLLRFIDLSKFILALELSKNSFRSLTCLL